MVRRLEVFGLQSLVGEDLANDSLRVDDEVGRCLRDAVQSRDVTRYVYGDGIGDLVPLDVLIDAIEGIRLVEVDGDDGDVIWVIGIKFIELGGRGLALGAPAGPEFQDYSLAFELIE